MKKHISFSALFLCVSLQYTTYAASPCTTSFALGYAIATRAFATGVLECEGLLLEGNCILEELRNYSHSASTLFTEFNACCCANSYVECCN